MLTYQYSTTCALLAAPCEKQMVEITTLSELTIDGKLSLGPNASSTGLFNFYGDELRSWFHKQRAAHDAIMVGAGTVVNDNPQLTVRHAPGQNPLRIIPSTLAKLPLEARLLNDGFPTLVVACHRASEVDVAALRAKVNVEVLMCGDDAVDLPALMEALDQRGIKSLVVEGGSRLIHSLHRANLVDRIIIKHIPVITGSIEAPIYMRPHVYDDAVDLSRWRLVDCFSKSGVAVTMYEPLTERR
jgi:riboflavin-specific deaminase-like protein